MAYLIRRLLENTANSSFLHLEERPVEELCLPVVGREQGSRGAGEQGERGGREYSFYAADTDYADMDEITLTSISKCSSTVG